MQLGMHATQRDVTIFKEISSKSLLLPFFLLIPIWFDTALSLRVGHDTQY